MLDLFGTEPLMRSSTPEELEIYHPMLETSESKRLGKGRVQKSVFFLVRFLWQRLLIRVRFLIWSLKL